MENKTLYKCSACGFPVSLSMPNCPQCGATFSTVATISQDSTPDGFGVIELGIACAFGIGIGVIIGAMGARKGTS